MKLTLISIYRSAFKIDSYAYLSPHGSLHCMHILPPNISQVLNMVDVAPYTDSDPITARGTPMARPKIGNSIVDVIGGTPMVCINHEYLWWTQHFLTLGYKLSTDSPQSPSCWLSRNNSLKAREYGALQQCEGSHRQKHGWRGRESWTYYSG